MAKPWKRKEFTRKLLEELWREETKRCKKKKGKKPTETIPSESESVIQPGEICNDDAIDEWEDLEVSDGEVEEDVFAEFETRNEEDELSETVIDPAEFWSYVHKLVDGRGKIHYDTLCNFVKFIMILPHS